MSDAPYDVDHIVDRKATLYAGNMKFAIYVVSDPVSGEEYAPQVHLTQDNTILALLPSPVVSFATSDDKLAALEALLERGEKGDTVAFDGHGADAGMTLRSIRTAQSGGKHAGRPMLRTVLAQHGTVLAVLGYHDLKLIKTLVESSEQAVATPVPDA